MPQPARPSAAIPSAIAAAVFAAVPSATTSAEPRQTIAFEFEDIQSADGLKQRFEREVKDRGRLEWPKLTFHLPEAEVDGAVARALDLISRQQAWEDETVIRGCGPAGTLCFVITCERCGGAR